MVSAEDLIKGTKSTTLNPRIELRQLYDSINQELVTLNQKGRKINTCAERIMKSLDTIEQAKASQSSMSELKINSAIPTLKAANHDIILQINESTDEVLPNLMRKMERIGKIVDQYPESADDSFQKQVAEQYNKIEEGHQFITDVRRFLETVDMRQRIYLK